MADQRRGEPRGHRRGRRAGARGVGLLLTLLAALGTACGSDPRGPDPFDPGGGGTGVGSGGGSSAALVGTWRNVTVVEVPGDIQTWTTTWRFDAGTGCRQTVETESLAEGIPRVTECACEYAVDADEVTITFTGGGAATFDFFFAAFSPDRLVLDGFEYERLA